MTRAAAGGPAVDPTVYLERVLALAQTSTPSPIPDVSIMVC